MTLGLRRPLCRLPRSGMIIAVAINTAPDDDERGLPEAGPGVRGDREHAQERPRTPSATIQARLCAPQAGADIATDPGLWCDVTKDPYLSCARPGIVAASGVFAATAQEVALAGQDRKPAISAGLPSMGGWPRRTRKPARVKGGCGR